jgi:hypothetical protein
LETGPQNTQKAQKSFVFGKDFCCQAAQKYSIKTWPLIPINTNKVACRVNSSAPSVISAGHYQKINLQSVNRKPKTPIFAA